MREPEPSTDFSTLIEDYLAAKEAGSEDLEAFAQRAGDRRADLEGLSRLVHDLEDAFELLSDVPDVPHVSGGAGDDGDPARDAAPGDPMARPHLERVGRFEVLQLLGQGGLSSVFLAYDPNLRRHVALKVLTATGGVGTRELVEAEGQSLARLRHDNVVQVYEVGEEDGVAFFAMEHIAGPSLAEVIEASSGAAESPSTAVAAAGASLNSIGARCRLVATLARALAYCHGRGIIHRDVKPANVLLASGEVPKLIDFGLAHLALDGRSLDITRGLAGTPAYMAPEQIDGNRTGASPASDIFSLGVVLYELLTLRHPFRRPTYAETAASISRAAPDPLREIAPEIPLDAERICLHALERRPEDRYGSADALADDLEAFLDHRAISLGTPLLTYSVRLWARRHRGRLALGAGALLGSLLLSGGLWLSGEWTARREFDRSLAAKELEIAGLDDAGPRTFMELFYDLSVTEGRVEDFRGSALTRRLFDDRRPRVAALWTTASDRMHARVAADQEAILTSPDALKLATRRRSLDTFFRGWLEADMARLRYSRSADLEPIVVNSVRVPAGGQLSRMQAADCVLNFFPRPIAEHENLAPGSYRLTADGAQGPLETEFLLTGFEIEYAPPPPRSEASLFDDWVQVPGSGDGVPWCAFELQPFEFTPRPVSVQQIARIFSESELARLDAMRRPDAEAREAEAVAFLPWPYARELARRVGARLPTPGELVVAARHADLATDPEQIGYWTSMTGSSDEPYVLMHEVLIRPDLWSDSPSLLGLLSTPAVDGVAVGIGLHLVRPARTR